MNDEFNNENLTNGETPAEPIIPEAPKAKEEAPAGFGTDFDDILSTNQEKAEETKPEIPETENDFDITAEEIIGNTEPEIPHIPENPIYSQSTQPEDSGEYVPPHVNAERTNANPYSSSNSTYNGNGYQGNAFGGGNPVPPYNPVPEKKSEKKGVKIFVAAIALILVFALGVGTATIFKSNNNSTSGDTETSVTGDTAKLEIAETPTSKKKSSTTDGALTASEIAENARKWNVGIVIYSGNSTSVSGQGSGIVMSRDSTGRYTYIITCAHVIDESGVKCSVQTEDGTTYDADIVGYDTRTDIGVLKVETTDLEIAEFGDSDDLAVGDPVYAIGNPGGVEFFGSFTGGHISAINRPVSSEIGYTMKCIQHDASINPGNSGGMLVNQYGQVVGINSQKIASTSYEGMGFAIPITSAKEIIDDLIAYSYVPNRAKLGINYTSVSASTQYSMIAQIKGLPAGTLIITNISDDSGLNQTSAKVYDMIIAVNGKELTTADVLLELVDGGKVGDKLTLTLCRVNSNYSIDEFDVEVELVEDKGTTEETTTQQTVNPFDYFYGYGN